MRAIRPRLSVSILAFLSCLLILTWLLFSIFAFKSSEKDLYAQKGEHAATLLTIFTGLLPESLPTFPADILPTDSPSGAFARKMSEEEAFTRLTLLDANGKVIFTTGKDGSDIFQPFSGVSPQQGRPFVVADGSGIAHVAQVMRSGELVGSAGIVLPLAAEHARLYRSRQLFMAYFAIDFILLLGLGSFILSRIVVSPLTRLLSATEKITRGHYGQKVPVSGGAELVRLAESFNQMSGALLAKEQQVSDHVTALEDANRQLEQAREEAVHTEKMASIGLLAAGMAHEVGTPLAAVMGYAELLSAESTDTATVLDYARRISEDCSRIDRIVRGLLDYARPRGSVLEPCDLPALVTASLNLLEQQGIFKRIERASDFDSQLPCVMVDSHQLQQVIINLALNARDAMPDGGKLSVRGSVTSDLPVTFSKGQMVRLDILDSGSGIPPEHITRIFDPFFTTKPPGRGTGLGLAISARIVESFGGRITVQSRGGSGSCFIIWLPIALKEERG